MEVVAVCVQGCLGKHCLSQRRTGNNLKTQRVGNGWVPCGSAVLSESHAALDKEVGMRPPSMRASNNRECGVSTCVRVHVCTHRDSECGRESEGEREGEERKRGRQEEGKKVEQVH